MRGRLHLEVRTPDGAVQTARRARNTVMRSGANLVATLFAGQGTPVTHMGVGTSDADPDSVTTAALTNEAVGDQPPLQGDAAVAIPPGVFAFETDDVRRVVRVRLRATLPAGAAVGTLREAGLLARPAEGDDADVLYNRVTFAPVSKGDDHELTMFWEVEFPFGDLQWL